MGGEGRDDGLVGEDELTGFVLTEVPEDEEETADVDLRHERRREGRGKTSVLRRQEKVRNDEQRSEPQRL
jgi:hypothetical protein